MIGSIDPQSPNEGIGICPFDTLHHSLQHIYISRYCGAARAIFTRHNHAGLKIGLDFFGAQTNGCHAADSRVDLEHIFASIVSRDDSSVQCDRSGGIGCCHLARRVAHHRIRFDVVPQE